MEIPSIQTVANISAFIAGITILALITFYAIKQLIEQKH
jgi:hypothetical protein